MVGGPLPEPSLGETGAQSASGPAHKDDLNPNTGVEPNGGLLTEVTQ